MSFVLFLFIIIFVIFFVYYLLRKIREPFKVDNCAFQLHYIASMEILKGFSFFIIAVQFGGDPIDCIVDSEIGKNPAIFYVVLYFEIMAKN